MVTKIYYEDIEFEYELDHDDEHLFKELKQKVIKDFEEEEAEDIAKEELKIMLEGKAYEYYKDVLEFEKNPYKVLGLNRSDWNV